MSGTGSSPGCSRSSTSGDPPAAHRDRRGERNGRRDDPAGARAASAGRRGRCYFEPDGSFPNHEPNPLLPENREFIVRARPPRRAPTSASRTTATPTAASSSTTPGEFVPGDFMTTLFAESILEQGAGRHGHLRRARVWAVPEAIEAAGGVALINRVGHAFIKQRMRDVDAVFGGEVSAHYYFRDFCQADSGVVPFLLMLELVSSGPEAERAARAARGRGTSSPARSTRRSPTWR